MQNNTLFTSLLCAQQAIICYINSFVFKNLPLFGSMQNIMLVSNFAEIMNNLFRAISMIIFRYIGFNTMFIINNISAVLLLTSSVVFTLALYNDLNIYWCSISWFLNRICNSIHASCRDVMLYKLNKEHNANINIPIVKTIKSIGNILLLIKLCLLTGSIYNVSLIYVHCFVCIFAGYLNIIACWILKLLSNKLIMITPCSDSLDEEVNSSVKNMQITESNKNIIHNIIKLTLIIIVINIAQVDDSIVFFQLPSHNQAFILKQCVGQIGLGLIYSLLFKNSRILLIVGPIIPLLFHQFSILQYYRIACVVMGLQYMLKNTSYLLFSIILCNYNFIYPAICIIADAASILISNGIFMLICKYYSLQFAYTFFRNLGLIALLVGIILWYYTNYQKYNLNNKDIIKQDAE